MGLSLWVNAICMLGHSSFLVVAKTKELKKSIILSLFANYKDVRYRISPVSC
ncbi:hypothetical protein Lalb_Chr11g0062711 [Lupinus albus]|uniref:Uncharacterized protein n=1 Tax=Lupinus albus TaxID=3870 RepID=A0A6A4PQ31_LUPAL|nr:hypothetical protein Lalb_Chr11g0062711 [Lupinus albus]